MGMPQAATPTPTRWTADMVRALPDDGNRYEVIDGELFVIPAPNIRHQRGVARLFQGPHPRWGVRMYTGMMGETLASPADISTREDRLVQPDVFVFPCGQTPVRDWADITHLLLAVEVLSPSTARADRQVKRRLYREIADEYWIVDLDARLIEPWRPDDQRPEIITERLTWQPAAAIPPFDLPLPPYFDQVGPE